MRHCIDASGNDHNSRPLGDEYYEPPQRPSRTLNVVVPVSEELVRSGDRDALIRALGLEALEAAEKLLANEGTHD